MPWAKIDDGWWCHPKVMALDLEACGLWARALSWSCAQRTPAVPAQFPAMVGASEATAKQIEATGLWHGPGHDCPECDDPETGWIIHDWHEYQERTLSEKRADAGRKGGKASGKARRSAKQTEATDEATAKQTPKQVPVPSRPVPEPPSAADAPQAGVVAQVTDELVAVFHDGTPPPDGTRTAWQVDEAARQIARWKPDTGEVARRSRCWPDTWGTQTAMGLAKWWNTCRPPPSPSDEPYEPPPELPAADPIPDEVRSRWSRRREVTA